MAVSKGHSRRPRIITESLRLSGIERRSRPSFLRCFTAQKWSGNNRGFTVAPMKHRFVPSLFALVNLAALALAGASCSKTESSPSAAASASPSGSAASAPTAAKPPLRIAFSDWPGWSAYEIAIQKGWFKEAGVETDFSWFEYSASMEAYTAGKVDAVMMTMGDALVTGASGAKSVAILINDYSNGNDMIVAKPGIGSLRT